MSETLTQTVARLTAFIQSQAPNIDLSPGSVFSELVLNLESQVQNQLFSDIDDISNSQSIQSALTSLTDTYSPVIDAIASNYNVYRNQGTYSNGILLVYVAASTNYNVSAGCAFTQPTLGYVYTAANQVSVTPNGTGTTQKLQSQNGLYCFTVPVVAQTVGQVTTINNGTLFSINNPSQIPNFVSAQALGTFTAGLNTETDKALIARFRNGLGINTLLSQNSITNQLATQFPNFQDVYLADLNSPVNTRSLSTPLGIKVPGCVDVWVKDGVTLQYTTFAASSASYIGNNTWTLTLPSTALGFYRIDNVQTTTGALLPFITNYGYTTGGPNVLNTAIDARFSIYQTATLTVTAPYQTPAPVFNVTALIAPDLAAMQALFLNESYRIPCADYLVKGIVPCLVSLNISLILNNPGDTIDTTSLQADIFNYINGLGSGEVIAVSQIVKLCHNYNINRVDLPLIVNGTILSPTTNDNNIMISGTDFLQIPYLPSQGVIPENTMFFITYFDDQGNQNININIS